MPQPQPRLTLDEYLALERQSEARHEFFDGEIFAMAGASWRHGLIVSNLLTALSPRLAARDCFVHASDLRVLVEASDLCTYPDLVVVCGEPQFSDASQDTLLNPIVLIEVLSDSTEAYDRGTKSTHYRTIASLQDVVLISQHQSHVERFSRQGRGWEFWESHGAGDALELPSVGARVELEKIYHRVDFDTETSRMPFLRPSGTG